MRLPTSMPTRAGALGQMSAGVSRDGALVPQGCNPLEWLACGTAIAGCAALSGPAFVACVAAAAPGCVKCVS